MTDNLYGEFEQLAPLMLLRERLESAALDNDLAWVLPTDVLPGVTMAYGLPVLRMDGVSPMLAHRMQGS